MPQLRGPEVSQGSMGLEPDQSYFKIHSPNHHQTTFYKSTCNAPSPKCALLTP